MCSKRKIWIINQYGNLPSIGIGGRHYYLACELSLLGHTVTNISARWSHVIRNNELSQTAPKDEFIDGFRFYRIDVPRYRHAHNKKRVLNWFLFAWHIRNLEKKLGETPEVIIYSSPSLVAYLSAYRLSKKFNATLIFEVRDIWPLTLIQLGGFSPRHPFIRFMQWIEDFAYKKSHHVISNLEGASEHAKSRGLNPKKFTWVPNGYDEKELSYLELASSKILDAIQKQEFSVTYTGAVGQANSLDTLVDAANVLKDRQDVHFNIVGGGMLVHKLIKRTAELGLQNVHFWGAVPKSQVQSILRVSSVCVICWQDSVLYKHGLAANKLFDYMYSGRPIINAYSGGYDIVQRYEAGITVPAGDPVALSGAISKLASMDSSELATLGGNGLKAVRKYHEYSQIVKTLEQVALGDTSL